MPLYESWFVVACQLTSSSKILITLSGCNEQIHRPLSQVVRVPVVEAVDWKTDDVTRWQKEARQVQTIYCNLLSQIDYHIIRRKTLWLLRNKILYGLYGVSPSDAKEEQADKAQFLTKKVIEMTPRNEDVHVGFVYVYGKMNDERFIEPVLRVTDTDKENHKFLDRTGRVYQDWNDWKENNFLPKCLYCYPRNGFYRMESNLKDVVLDCGTSPACDLTARLATAADTVCKVLATVAFGLGVAACFHPLSPVVSTFLLMSSQTTGVYNAARHADRLRDKKKHKESLTDREAIACWLKIAGVVLGMSSDIAVAYALENRVRGETVTTAARLALLTTSYGKLTTDGVAIVNQLALLSEKDEITPQDVLQITSSVFFYLNVLISETNAATIMSQLQTELARSTPLQEGDHRQLQQLLTRASRGRSEQDSDITTRSLSNVSDTVGFLRNLSSDEDV